MYYIDEKEIQLRLEYIPKLVGDIEHLTQAFDPDNNLHFLAQERLLHLSIEVVTDIGSYLIDGFMMREASSYEDIIEVLEGEKVFSSVQGQHLLSLVRLRRPLVQEYISFERINLHSVINGLPDTLKRFAEGVESFITKELF